MMNPDVIVIGSGGGGAVVAKELGERGVKVLVLEAGPWYGNRKWPNPNVHRGATYSSDFADLDIVLYKKALNEYEDNMNDLIAGRFRWGPADRKRSPWFRNIMQKGTVMQVAGVGGTTLHYTGNSPRAYPIAIDHIWPITYRELIPYYEKVEATLPVAFAPTTAKEEMFYYGAKKAGWRLIPTLNVTSPGYRPNPNAILPPNEHLMNPHVPMEQLSWMEGCTLAGHCINGCPHGPSVDKIAKRSTNVSYVPLALQTGNVTIRPNAFATKIVTESHPSEGVRAIGVQIRDTWTGEVEELRAEVVVMAAGTIETPRLWLNSELPQNPWVGKGLTNHYMDWISGVFDEKDLLAILGSPDINPFVGQNLAARLDYPGLGMLTSVGMSPGLLSMLSYGVSESGYEFLHPSRGHDPWDVQGILSGPLLKEIMANYRKTLTILISIHDDVDQRNSVTINPTVRDEHGPVPVIQYSPTARSANIRRQMVKIAAEILQKAGAKTIAWSNWPIGMMFHIMSTMRMGFVVDDCCEAYQVKRLYIADNSVLFNALGGPNPTLTTQALATRTAEKLANKYFN
ncbi:GMC family oxidoreductase N-terminal domain-containing protein [Brevibacillus migulae]|uniref:GMC family oxidoreductase N-terminal domain-containing protein n=1 Tax=Brevibacillus migulae TaxID=1644114 RepID=UPI00106E4C84|nr:GMC family oxidoreductase [Brevibacillus migulae]